jgi:hypothetical protein
MHNQINEPIDVVAKFIKNKLVPIKFFWKGREIVIHKINLTWSSFEGRNKFYFFAVSDSANYFKLHFNSDNLSWTLLESYAD